MGDAGFFKGTSSEQDTRFKDKEKSLLKSINFPKELDQKVNMRKVELSVMKPWISDKIIELLGFEDEVVVEYVHGLLDDPTSPIVDPKKMQINLTGFLESKTGAFMSELWALLLSAQQSPLKIPALFIEQKKEEMRKKEEADLEAQAAIKRRQEQEEENERRLAEIRRRERGQGNNRNGNPSFDHSQRNGSRGDNTSGGYHSRGNFMPPRSRDSGWGNRAEARLSDKSIREPPSTGKRDRSRSRSRSRTRRDSQAHKGNGASSRRSRSPSRSRYRSRSRSPPSRRTQRRASPSPRPRRRHAEATSSRRSRSPSRSRHRSRSPPPRRTHRKASPSPRPHRRHAEAGSSKRSSSRSRHRSRSRSPPSRRSQRRASPSPLSHYRHAESSRSERRGSSHRDAPVSASDDERSSSSGPPPRASPPQRSMSPPRHSNQQSSTVISIKGRASKLTAEQREASQPASAATGEKKIDRATEPPNQTRSRNLTEVVKERLLREKVKASMNQI